MNLTHSEKIMTQQVSASLSPVQEFYVWYEKFETDRRVSKAKKRRGYFHEENEKAIIAYNKEESATLRNKVYTQHIHKPFMKLAENIIHTFKFYCFDDSYVDVLI